MKIYIKSNRTSLHLWEKNYCSIFGLNQTSNSADAQSLVISQSFEPSWVKNSGMENLPAKFCIKDFRTNLTLFDDDVNNLGKSWIEKALRFAENILKDEETLLLQMANYLSDNRGMKKELIEEYCVNYGANFNPETIIRNGDLLFYRKHLKEKVKNVNDNKIQVPANNYELCLNKGEMGKDEIVP